MDFIRSPVIDATYRGPPGILPVNPGAGPFAIAHAPRRAQLRVAPLVQQAAFEPAGGLSVTARGAGGFGTSGKGREWLQFWQ